MTTETLSPSRLWARFRLLVIATLLSCPPRRGELHDSIRALAARRWVHPISGDPLVLGFSTIERWYYQARDADDPLAALKRKVRSDAGLPRLLDEGLITALVKQFQQHPGWSYWLHHRNLAAISRRDDLSDVPSYSTVRRFMRSAGLHKRRKRSQRGTPAALAAEARLEQREVRSYESEYVGQLYHSDFHIPDGRALQIPLRDGSWATPVLCAVIDDRSRLICHAQWYLTGESTESYTHCLWQALGKRGLPRGWMHDNGAPMKAGETRGGLDRLGIEEHRTLAYSPDQNGKQESFWAKLESRLMPQLEAVAPHDKTLALLNEATLAFVEVEHNAETHSETGEAPRELFVAGVDVLRSCPPSAALRQAFTIEISRSQRRSDGTTTIDGVRFEIPSTYRHLERLALRYARWDLSVAYLCDPRSDHVLCALHPLDKRANADGRRKALRPPVANGRLQLPDGIAPHLLELIQGLRAHGLPTPFIAKD
jgi:transposase InsO family protein